MSTINASAMTGAVGITPATYSSTQTGTGVAVPAGCDHVVVTFAAGTFTSSAAMAVTVQSSDTLGSGYTAITGAAFASVSSSNDVAVYQAVVRLHGNPGFVRIVSTYSGSGNCPMAVSFGFTSYQYAEGNEYAFNVTDGN